jgi:hypothetical protein
MTGYNLTCLRSCSEDLNGQRETTTERKEIQNQVKCDEDRDGWWLYIAAPPEADRKAKAKDNVGKRQCRQKTM